VKLHSQPRASSRTPNCGAGATVGASSATTNCARAPCKQLHWLVSCGDSEKCKCRGRKKRNSKVAVQTNRFTLVAAPMPKTTIGVKLIDGYYLVNQALSAPPTCSPSSFSAAACQYLDNAKLLALLGNNIWGGCLTRP